MHATLSGSLYVHVALLSSGSALDHPLTYRIPECVSVVPGQCVQVPVRGREEVGYALAVTSCPEPPRDLRIEDEPLFTGKVQELSSVLDAPPLFDRASASLFCWMAREYVSSMGAALRCVVPPYRASEMQTIVHLEAEDLPSGLRSPVASHLLTLLQESGGALPLEKLERALSARRLAEVIRRLESRGAVRTVRTVRASEDGRTVLGLQLRRDATAGIASPGKNGESPPAALGQPLTTLQSLVIQYLSDYPGPVPQAEMLKALGCSESPVKSLIRKERIERVMIPVRRNPWSGSPQTALPLSLNHDQESALRSILERVRQTLTTPRAFLPLTGGEPEPADLGEHLGSAPFPAVILVRGVTGSGKTELYLRAIEETVKLGRQAIFLVPEISLTTQMLKTVHQRFPGRAAVLHSKLSEGEKTDEWRRIARGEVDVVLGARSALFAPTPDLGLVVVDEEHESSYKHEHSPKYVTRDVAVERCRRTAACLILGSATPSLEVSWWAERGAAHQVILRKRVVDRPMPRVRIVDQRLELKESPGRLFSRDLESAIEDRLKRREQVILFLNRRGFATVTLCRECGYVAQCRNCIVSLTFYASTRLLRCHHCGFTLPAPSECPSCNGARIRQFGLGTEKVERELRDRFPDARVARMDTDSTARKDAARQIVERFSRREIDLLVGTQMIAKGFHFPHVTLVGVVSADTMLNLPDFRAPERSFQLLTQVAGRSGRGDLPGEVIIQTFNPDHYAVRAASRHDYEMFFQAEMNYRREARYPPFSRLANILADGASIAEARVRSARAVSVLNEFPESEGLEILGPNPAPLARIKGRFRWHILLKSEDRDCLRDACRQLRARLPAADIRHMQIDLDPGSLL